MSIPLLLVKERISMSVKRKSNWYIYFIAFGITLVFVFVAIIVFKWYLFPDEKTQTGVDSSGNLTADYKPSAKENFNVMLMVSQETSKNPELFIMVEFNAVDNRVVLIPIPSGISVKAQGNNLTNIYASGGGQGVIDAVKSITGVQCESYTVFSKKAFTEIVQSFGNVKYNVPKTVIISDNFNAETINAGEKLFSAETLYAYIMQADFGEGELYRFNIIGDILSELINQNYRDLNGGRLNSFFSNIGRECETNADSKKFDSHKAAILYAIEYGSSPAEYYIPYGEYTSDGGFNISDNSVITIKQKAGLL